MKGGVAGGIWGFSKSKLNMNVGEGSSRFKVPLLLRENFHTSSGVLYFYRLKGCK